MTILTCSGSTYPHFSVVGLRNMLFSEIPQDSPEGLWVRRVIATAKDTSLALTWVFDARNNLIHQERLLHRSRVEFGVFERYGVLKFGYELEVDPLESTSTLTERLLADAEDGTGLVGLGMFPLDEDQYFGLTRHWVLEVDGENIELLDATAEALSHLRGIVAHIHMTGPTGTPNAIRQDCERGLLEFTHVPLLIPGEPEEE